MHTLMKQPVVTNTAPAPKGPYSQGIITGGRLLFVAGQGPVDPATGKFLQGDFDEQAVRTFENVKSIVEAAGAHMANSVKTNVYLRDMANFEAMNAIYRRYFPEPFPARTTVQSDLPGFLIEVDVIAHLE